MSANGVAIQVFRDVDHVVLDKTGTITEGEPSVDTVVSVGDHDERDVLRTAASTEAFSEHPLADAILDHADATDVNFPDPKTFDSVIGKGVRATVDGDDVLVGKPGWLDEEGVDLSNAHEEIERLQSKGLTTVGVIVSGDLIGLIGIGDEIKHDAKETIDHMKARGITPVMITGDNERTAQAVAEDVGIERVMADVLPDDKRNEVRKIQDEGHRVAMVGDGINDAPALTQADIGIAIGAGTDIAIESADIVLMGDRLGGVMDAYEIGETSYDKTKQNLIAAFSFNGIGVTAAVTGLVHPVFAMIAMIASVSLVLANSFAGQLLSGEGIKTDFSVETVEPDDESDADADATAETPADDESPGVELADATGTGQPARETVVFDVDLNCDSCEDRVTDALARRDGIPEVVADADVQRVEATFNPHQISADELRDTISDLEYTVEVAETPALVDRELMR